MTRHILCMGFFVTLLTLHALPESVAADRKLSQLEKKLVRAFDVARQKDASKAIQEIAEVNSSTAVGLIVKVVAEYRDIDVFSVTVKSLAKMDKTKARAALIKYALKSKEWAQRYLAVSALLLVKDDVKVQRALIDVVVDESRPIIWNQAFDRLSQLREPWVVDGFIGILEKNSRSKSKSELVSEVRNQLRAMTGVTIEDPKDWRKWWDGQSATFEFPTRKKKKGRTSVQLPTVRERLKARDEEQFLEELVDADVVVVEGEYDEVQEVLEELEIPHEVISREDVLNYDLKQNAVMVFNCHEQGGELSSKAIKRIQAFVKRGGYVFTSDWELGNVVNRAFPKYMPQAGLTDKEMKVSIRASGKYADHPLLRDVFPRNPFRQSGFVWVIDAVSSLPRILPGRAIPLVESSKLRKRYKVGTVAATFRYGRGAVLHVLGHFRAQRIDTSDKFALQQLLANFIIEKRKEIRKASRDKKR